MFLSATFIRTELVKRDMGLSKVRGKVEINGRELRKSKRTKSSLRGRKIMETKESLLKQKDASKVNSQTW